MLQGTTKDLMPTLGVTPLSDESLIGFMYRLAARQRRVSATAFARSLGFDRLTNRPEPSWLEALAKACDVSFDQIAAISYGPPDAVRCTVRHRVLRARYLDQRGAASRKVCPACLMESPHHRCSWDLLCVSACARHSTLLTDTCACGQPLHWPSGRDVTRNACRLRCDLTKRVGDLLPPADIEAVRAVAGLLGDEEFTHDAEQVRGLLPCQDLDDGEVVDFIFRLGLERMGGQSKLFSIEQIGEMAWQAHAAFTVGLAAARDWPDGLAQVLEGIVARTNLPTPRSAAHRSVARWLDDLSDGHGQVIRAALEDWRQRSDGSWC